MIHTNGHNHKIIKCGDNMGEKRQTKGKETPDKYRKSAINHQKIEVECAATQRKGDRSR